VAVGAGVALRGSLLEREPHDRQNDGYTRQYSQLSHGSPLLPEPRRAPTELPATLSDSVR
jgi:hypothetical protein